jgi:hypothetical protein
MAVPRKLNPEKRMILAQCKHCGYIVWWFSDEQTWDDLINMLRAHLARHVKKGSLSPEVLTKPMEEFYTVPIIVPATEELKISEEEYTKRYSSPGGYLLIPEEEYEFMKNIAKESPATFLVAYARPILIQYKKGPAEAMKYLDKLYRKLLQ